MPRTRRGATNTPAVGHGVVGVEDLLGGHRVVLADGGGADGRAGPVAGARAPGPGTRPGSSSPVGWPNPRLLIWASRRVLAQPLGDLDGAEVGGLGQDLAGREVLGAVGLGVVEGVGPHRQGGRHVDHLVGGGQAVGQGRREGDQLEDRAGLVDLGDRRVGGSLFHAGRQGVGLGDQGRPRRGSSRWSATVGATGASWPLAAARWWPSPWWTCRSAMARMSPVFTSSTTAMPLKAWEAAISAARACSATYCTDSSMVSSRPVPGSGEHRAGPVTGQGARRLGTPAGSRSRPGRPAVDWYWYSRPEVPVAVPSDRPHHRMGQLPVGLHPLGLGDQVDPGQVRAVTLAATALETRWAR